MAGSPDVERVANIVLRSMRWPLLSLFLIYVVGIAGFALIPGGSGEPLSFFHAIYILSYTATTTGFGELPIPFNGAQRLWVIVLLHVTVIAWLYSIGAILRLVQNDHFRSALARHVFARRVAGIGEPFVIVCGFGDAGSLLARSLNDSATAVVVIDRDPDRIKALGLRNFDVRVLGVCGDAGDPNLLVDAGLRHPCCRCVVAVTDDEQINAKAGIVTRALNPDLRPICRVGSRALGDELEALGSLLVLDAFEIFSDRLCTALHRPAVHALENWLAQVAEANLDFRIDCPRGHWIVCGYGRMGHRLEESMRGQDIRMVVIDPDIAEEGEDENHIRGAADPDTLARAGLAKAACVIVATDDDTVNLRVMMSVRRLDPDVFLVVRQNRHANDVVFTDTSIDLVVHPDRVLARRIQLELMSPGLPPLLDHLENGAAALTDTTIARLRDAVGEGMPSLWVTELDPESAPALIGPLSRVRAVGLRLGDLIRDPQRRERRIDCVPLQLERDGVFHPLPEHDTQLEPGDRVLFCGTWRARTTTRAVLLNPYTLDYLVSGEDPPRSYVSRWVRARRARASA